MNFHRNRVGTLLIKENEFEPKNFKQMLNIELFYGKPESCDFDTIIDQFSNFSFESIKRSTIALIEYWKNYNKILPEILNKIDVVGANNVKICWEYPVKSYQKNKASFTDVMIMGNFFCVAVEAKYKEISKKDIHKTVSQWHSVGSKNKENVLEHWLKHIRSFSNNELKSYKFGDIVYQLIHRTASACACANSLKSDKKQAVVIYEIFNDINSKTNKKIDYREEIKKLVTILGPKRTGTHILEFYLQEIEIEKNNSVIKTFENLKRKELSESIRNIIKYQNLYKITGEIGFEKIE